MTKSTDNMEKSEDNKSVTAIEIIENQLQLENDARETLPYDFSRCTYTMGSLRQPIYSCLTCQEKQEANLPAGICYSCSISCHSEHELVEIFEKRNFTCDCGTTKITANGGCNLRKNFDELDPPNTENIYNHNFYGKFCDCDKKYDFESESGVMIQCFLGDACDEDWYHEKCILGSKFTKDEQNLNQNINDNFDKSEDPSINSSDLFTREPSSPKGHPTGIDLLSNDRINEENTPVSHPYYNFDSQLLKEKNFNSNEILNFPQDDDYEAFICWKCVDKHKDYFLRWSGWDGVAMKGIVHFDNKKTTKNELKRTLNSCLEEKIEKKNEEIISKKIKIENDSNQNSSNNDKKNNNETFGNESISTNDASTNEIKDSIKQDKCTLPKNINNTNDSISLFLLPGFRDNICKCDYCRKIFLDKHPYFMTEEEHYSPPNDEDLEEDGTGSCSSSLFEAGSKAYAKLPHIQAIEGLHAYNDVKDKLSTFLRPFADQGKVVTAEDVKQFFAKIREEKSLGLEPSFDELHAK